jgi:hypothetical protein
VNPPEQKLSCAGCRDLTLSGAFIENGVHHLQYLRLHPETGEIGATMVEFFYHPATGESGVISP